MEFTREEAAEIYYALDSKNFQLHEGVFGNDPTAKKWALDIYQLMQKIGVDGVNLTDSKVETETEYPF